MNAEERIRRLLAELYDQPTGSAVAQRILSRYPATESPEQRRFRGSDSILITYADTLRQESEKPLATLGRFLSEWLPEMSHVHLLPFFPASGDGGFAVIDFRSVDPAFGAWRDVAALADGRRLMVDLVLNHVSTESDWFHLFLAGDPTYRRWFHVVDPGTDLATVFRPRTHPLLTAFPTNDGPVPVWTTFSAEQADLNFAHPPVLEEMVDILMGYVARGASVIRLDAVGYVWKEAGTPCLHHQKAHLVVKLLRAVLDRAAPHVSLVTETNVPHADNVSYFGSGDESQMVYNFSLPPLVLDAFLRRDTTMLTRWAAELENPQAGSFLNFLASHDGIGLTPVQDLLATEVIEEMAARTEAAGGLWSGRAAGDGSVRPYELNVGFIDALGMDTEGDERVVAERFLAAVAIQMSLRGVPGVYIHSALGTRSWLKGPRLSGEPRSINRVRLNLNTVLADLDDPKSLRSLVLSGHRRMLETRSGSGAFDPFGHQEVHDLAPEVFSIVRSSSDGEVWCLVNVTAEPLEVDPPEGWEGPRRGLLTGEAEQGRVHLPPYGYRWLVR